LRNNLLSILCRLRHHEYGASCTLYRSKGGRFSPTCSGYSVPLTWVRRRESGGYHGAGKLKVVCWSGRTAKREP
jgi:hypothetical protein